MPVPNPNQNQPPAQTYDQRLLAFYNEQLTANQGLADYINDPTTPEGVAGRAEVLTQLDTVRNAFAEGIARTTAATINGHVHGDEGLDGLREQYTMWHGIVGMMALREFDDPSAGANQLPPVNDPARAGRIRELSAIGVLSSDIQAAQAPQGGQPQVPQGTVLVRNENYDGEATKLANAVELARLQRAGFDQQGQATGGNRMVRAYRRASRWWSERGFFVKTAIMVGGGVVVGAAAIPLAAAAPAAAAAFVGAMGISRSYASAHMRNQGQVAGNVANATGQQVTRAHHQSQQWADTAVASHNTAHAENTDHEVSIEELANSFHNAARGRLRRNRWRAAIGTALTVGTVLGGTEIHHGIDSLVDKGYHDTIGKVFHGGGKGGRPEPSVSPSGRTTTPTPGAARQTPAPGGSGRVQTGAPVHPQTGTPVVPAEAAPHEQALQSFNPEKTAQVERVWATGTNANEMTHFVNVNGHLEVRLENVQPGETIINGHHIDPDTAANVKVAITFNGPNGPEMIFVPMHNGVAVMPDEISKSLLDGTPIDTEIVIQAGSSTHLEVLSTVVGHGTEISTSTFNHLVNSGTEATQQTQSLVPPVQGVPQSAEVQSYENAMYQEFAKTHGGVSPATHAEFNVALSEALSHGQIEFVTGAHGNISAIIPDGHYDYLAWQNADAQQIQAVLQNEVANKTTEGVYAVGDHLTGLTHYTDQVYQQYLQAHHLQASPEALKAFNTAFTEALKSNKFEVQVGANGDYSVIAPDPAFNNEIWENIPPSQVLDILSSQLEDQNGTLVPVS